MLNVKPFTMKYFPHFSFVLSFIALVLTCLMFLSSCGSDTSRAIEHKRQRELAVNGIANEIILYGGSYEMINDSVARHKHYRELLFKKDSKKNRFFPIR